MYRQALGVLAQAAAAAVWLASGTPVSAQQTKPASSLTEANAVCAACHEVGEKMAGNAHATVACSTCHVKHEEYPHPANIPKPVCSSCHSEQQTVFQLSVHAEAARKGNAGAPDCAVCHSSAHETKKTGTVDFRRTTLETCGMCHDKVLAEYWTSVHGRAAASGHARAPVCSDCHGEHDIRRPSNPDSRVAARNQPETCGSCHAGVALRPRFAPPLDRIASFEKSFHGLALRAGSKTVAACASCHGVHNILPSTDAKSQIHAANLAATCGKCHPGAGERFASLGPVHVVEGRTEAEPVRWIRQFYLILIPLVLGLMFVHNLGDFLRKLWSLRLKPNAQPHRVVGPPDAELRMHAAERLQHALLAVSFIVLTWTGFALIYPDHFWARPLTMWEDRWPVRGVVHRVSAVVFMIVAVLHVILTLRSPRLRHHWLELIPRRQDLPEAVMNFSYNVGLRRTRPVLSSHSYIEKAEYWAVVWGAVIMAASGLLLWANNWSLRNLPKVVLDIATAVHYYEAVLAAAAIVIWHFYFVLADPEVYPMDSAWLTGKSVRRRKRHEQNETDTGKDTR
ncbi:MAG TPA: cytochrome b/b6 domain-containing protein [Bryobacteraceae bacterium]|nr:cytochrome b/b6 domain-containing protein [Bryobacteraceae bacterium]